MKTNTPTARKNKIVKRRYTAEEYKEIVSLGYDSPRVWEVYNPMTLLQAERYEQYLLNLGYEVKVETI
jgi:hypothetical protein